MKKINWLMNACMILLVAHVITFTGAFLVAYMHPTKTVTIDINHFGEADLELILILSTTPLGLIYLFKSYKRNLKLEGDENVGFCVLPKDYEGVRTEQKYNNSIQKKEG